MPARNKFWLQLGGATIATIIIFSLALLYTTPRIDMYSQGFAFAELSTDPFVIHQNNGLHYRMLFPLLSWIFGLNNAGVVLMALTFVGLHLFIAIYGTVRRGYSWNQALTLGTILAVTISTQFPLVYGGFPDPISYCLMLLMLLVVRRGWLLWLCAGLALFNHESVALLFPFLVVYRWRHTTMPWSRWLVREILPAFTIMFGLYISYRWWVNSQMLSDVLTSGQAGSQMYCIFKALQNPLTCVRESNLLGVLFPLSIFGSFHYFLLLPLWCGYYFIKTKQYWRLVEFGAIIVACLSTFPINLDTTRIVGMMLLPIIVLSLWEWFARGYKIWYLWLLLSLTLLTPHLYVINGTLRYFRSWPNWWERLVLQWYPLIDIITGSLMPITYWQLGHMVIAAAILGGAVVAALYWIDEQSQTRV